MNGYAYYVISQYIDDGDNKGNFASAEKVGRSNNLISIFGNLMGVQTVNSCATFKEAKEIADYWNECYKANGTYAFAH